MTQNLDIHHRVRQAVCIVAVTALASPHACAGRGGDSTPTSASHLEAAGSVGIAVAFKLDPRLTGGVYLGDRWVSPATYVPVQQGATLTVDARAHVGTPEGPTVAARWTPSDAEMVTVTPGAGHEVRITIRRPGQSSVVVVSVTLSGTVVIKATSQNGVIHAELSQR